MTDKLKTYMMTDDQRAFVSRFFDAGVFSRFNSSEYVLCHSAHRYYFKSIFYQKNERFFNKCDKIMF